MWNRSFTVNRPTGHHVDDFPLTLASRTRNDTERPSVIRVHPYVQPLYLRRTDGGHHVDDFLQTLGRRTRSDSPRPSVISFHPYVQPLYPTRPDGGLTQNEDSTMEITGIHCSECVTGARDDVEQNRPDQLQQEVRLNDPGIKEQVKMKEIHTAIRTTAQEKCYNPSDPTLTFVDADDDLDFLCEGFQSRRARMSCGHAVTPMSLTNWCRRLLDEGKSSFVCGQSGCNVEWSFAEVCKMALLTPEEKEYFEKAMTSNAARGSTKSCPGCKSSVVRLNESDLNVRCMVCTANRRRIYEFCWQCLREWKGPAPRSDHCGNEGCCNESLKTLRSCPDINLKCVRGVTACPSIRACPTCGILLQYDNTLCKNIICPRCKVKFCFVCLKRTTKCIKTSKSYINCLSGVAPRQTSISVWKKK